MTIERTSKALSAITDAGVFERLATAILREAKPEYHALSHPGMNEKGKTIRSPVDGICFQSKTPQRMIVLHHATASDPNTLKSKWLNDPAKVKPRKNSPTAPPGDVIKTLQIIREERNKNPALAVTLILTTNEEPRESLVREVHSIADENNFEIDIWSRSRLAQFLDHDQTGQWIRKKYLAIEQELLSLNLLVELSKRSLEQNISLIFSGHEDLWINRGLDKVLNSISQPLSLVIGDSGNGKSVACLRMLKRHISEGGIGIVISHGILSEATTLAEAIFLTLKKLHPALDQLSSSALTFSSVESPLMILIEDVNRSNRPQDLIEKIISWAKNIHQKSDQCFHILCPAWPKYLALLEEPRKKDAEAYFVVASKYSPQEGENAVIEKAKLSKVKISKLKAQEIAKALGYDPLLIALQDINDSPDPVSVIGEYINDALLKAEACDASTNIASEYRDSLRNLAGCMLRHKQLEVTWSKLKSWSEISNDDVKAINYLARHGRVISYNSKVDDQVILFRHDRVRDLLLVDYIRTKLNAGQLEQDILLDPFYSEMIGRALSSSNLEEKTLELICKNTSLSLFYALKWSASLSEDKKKRLLEEIDNWVSDESNHSRAKRSMRFHALYVLTETDSSGVPAIINKFPENVINGQLARLRNGDISGGVELCRGLEPGLGSPWRDAQIEHAKGKYGRALVGPLNQILERSDADLAMRSGALRLAGHIGDEELSNSIFSCWSMDKNKAQHLDDYIWAFAQCWCEKSTEMLEPVMEAWASLSDDREAHMPSPRFDLAAYHLRWAFRKWPPARAIDYFIKHARREELRWPITYMLHCMDHPQAVKFVVEEMAEIRRRLEGTEQFSPFLVSAAHDWQQSLAYGRRSMSDSTRHLLLSMWTNKDSNKHTRVQAFSIWAAAIRSSDLDMLYESDEFEELKDLKLIQRLKLGDKSAITDLIEKASQPKTGYWWQYARHIWSEDLALALDKYLEERHARVSLEYFNWAEDDWIIAELIHELPEKQAESILLKHWKHLQYCPQYVQAALYITTPDSLKLAAQTIADSPDKEKMLEHLDSHYGIKTVGRSGVTRQNQIVALIPYIDYLSELTILSLWDLCNEKGWFELRKAHLDSKLSEGYNRNLWDRSRAKTQLDNMITSDRSIWIESWIDDLLETGVLWDEIFDLLIDWLNENKSEKKLNIVAAAVAHRGARVDTKTIKQYENLSESANEVICDTEYLVYRRTLN